MPLCGTVSAASASAICPFSPMNRLVFIGRRRIALGWEIKILTRSMPSAFLMVRVQ